MVSIYLWKKCQNGWVYDPDGFVLYCFNISFWLVVLLVFQRGEALLTLFQGGSGITLPGGGGGAIMAQVF